MNEDQYIETDGSETKYYSDREMTVLHREDGPAAEYASGYRYWYINNKLHREDGPAVEYDTGTKAWYTNGELHREDGPAVEWSGGGKEWFINGGKRLTEEEFNTQMKIVELTLDEIAEKFGVSVDKLKIKK